MISLVGNKWEGYTFTREYDGCDKRDMRNAIEDAGEKIGLIGPNYGSDTPTTTFERIAMQHGMLKNKVSVTEKF